MIKTLKKKVILGAVNVVNAWSNHQETENLLEFLSRLETSGDRPDWMHDGSENGPPPLPEGETRDPEEDQAPPIGERRDSFDGGKGRGFMAEPLTENDWRAAVYFTVRVRDGAVSDVDLTRISSVSEDEARAYGEQALAKGASGSLDSFRYTTAEAEDGSKVIVFLENSSRRNAVLRVAALSALAGIAGWGLMLLLVVLLSKKAVAPIAANMERQRQFVTDAGHELKTPIAIIRANTEAMELISGKTKWSKNIADQVTRLSDLTQNLLTLARADGAPRAGSLEPVDFTAIVEDTARMFQEPMALRGLGLEAALPGTACSRETGISSPRWFRFCLTMRSNMPPGTAPFCSGWSRRRKSSFCSWKTTVTGCRTVLRTSSLTGSTGATPPGPRPPAASASAFPRPGSSSNSTVAGSPPPIRGSIGSSSP